MTRVLVSCAGAVPSRRLEREDWDRRETIDHRGHDATLNISIRAPQADLMEPVGFAADLLRIAAYAFGADQQVRRGGNADLHGDDWYRAFTLAIPVSDPGFWNQPHVTDALVSALDFVSDDHWNFEFHALGSSESFQSSLAIEHGQVLGNPDIVALFSGGLDSLCSVIEQYHNFGRRPLLISHAPAFHVNPRQSELRTILSERFDRKWHFPRVSASINRRKSDAPETTHRTRSFLYGAVGAVAAHALRITEVQLADNGVVSLNLPINEQVIGAMATRSTNPKFLRLFNRLLQAVFPGGPSVSNPLSTRTRAETLEILKAARCADLIDATNSCAHQRLRTKMQPHCGRCSQCIDRRFATLAAGLEDYDPPERYEIDVLRDKLKEGPERTMAFSYYRFSQEVASLSDIGFFERFTPLADCIEPEASRQAESAHELVDMLKRHGQTNVKVMEEQIIRAAPDLARGLLPAESLLAVVASQRSDLGADSAVGIAEHDVEPKQPTTTPRISHTPDFRSITVDGRSRTLTIGQAAVFGRLYSARQAGTPDVAWSDLKRSAQAAGANPRTMRDVFKDSDARDALVESPRKGVYRLKSA